MACSGLILRFGKQASSVANKEPLGECDARGVVTITWDTGAGHFWIRNTSSRRVAVSLQTWPTATEMTLDGGESRPIHVAEFEQPVRATYAD